MALDIDALHADLSKVLDRVGGEASDLVRGLLAKVEAERVTVSVAPAPVAEPAPVETLPPPPPVAPPVAEPPAG